MGASDVEGGLSLFKVKHDPLISTDLFNKEQLRLEKLGQVILRLVEKVLQTIMTHVIEKLTCGGGKLEDLAGQ